MVVNNYYSRPTPENPYGFYSLARTCKVEC